MIDTRNFKPNKKEPFINFNDNKPTKTAKIAIFIIILLFAVGYFRYKPYQMGSWMVDDFSISTLFHIYFFVVNQTLGIVHESGHGVCYILNCPEFLTVINGTIFQLIFPLGIGIYFYFKNQKMGFYIALFFLGISLGYTAWYISTSYKGLYLSTSESFLGVDVYHDFYYILDKLSLLKQYKTISFLVNLLSTLIILFSLAMLFIESFLKDE